MTRQERYPDTWCFRYHNRNPKGRIADDCVVRAISTAMERPYEEVYRELFETSLKTGYMLNEKQNYEKYLEAQGWRKMAQPKHLDKTKYTGEEWCELHQIVHSERDRRMIAHIGGHHIVAIIDFKVLDTWNSTDGCIGNYWIKD